MDGAPMLRLEAVAFAATDPARLAAFWAELLDRPVHADERGALLPASDTQVGLRFTSFAGVNAGTRLGPDLMHLHVTNADRAGFDETVAAALTAGGRHRDVGQRPEEGHVVLADPEGNEFCVIPPGNAFLAGCGRLGEVACDGTREVGVFWAAALSWPLVWGEDQQTAIQSPHGGTKLGWGGPPLTVVPGRRRQRFELTLADDDVAAEVARLVALGATRRGGGLNGLIQLADPDGNEFELRRMRR